MGELKANKLQTLSEKEIHFSSKEVETTTEQKEKDYVPSSMMGSIYNLICMTAGSGLLMLPWSFSKSGLYPGMILCTISCMLATFTFFLIGVGAEHTQKYSWREIWRESVSGKTAVIPVIASWLSIFLLNFIFLILTGNFLEFAFKDLLPNLASSFPLRPLILVGVSICFVLPLSLLKDFTYLQYSSFIANLGLLYVMGILIFKNPGVKKSEYHIDYWTVNWGGLISCLSIQITSFSSHALAPQLYEELQDRSPKRFGIIVCIGFFICWVITMTFGIAGYIAFGNGVNGDVTKSYLPPAHGIDVVMILARFILALNMIATQAIYYSALARETISMVTEFNTLFRKNWIQKIEDFLTKYKRFVFIPCALAFILGLSLLFKNVEVMGELVGSTASMWTIVLFPTLVYLYLKDSKYRTITWFIFVFGVLIAILCFIQFILVQVKIQI